MEMQYVMRITRPKIDTEEMTLDFPSRAEAADAAACFLMCNCMFDPETEVVSVEPSEDELLITTTSGIIHVYPKGIQ